MPNVVHGKPDPSGAQLAQQVAEQRSDARRRRRPPAAAAARVRHERLFSRTSDDGLARGRAPCPLLWRTNSPRNQVWKDRCSGVRASDSSRSSRQNASARSSSSMSCSSPRAGDLARVTVSVHRRSGRRPGRLDPLRAQARSQRLLEGSEQVGEVLRQRVVLLVRQGEQPHLAPQLSVVMGERDVRRHRDVAQHHLDPLVGGDRRVGGALGGDAGDPTLDALLGEHPGRREPDRLAVLLALDAPGVRGPGDDAQPPTERQQQIGLVMQGRRLRAAGARRSRSLAPRSAGARGCRAPGPGSANLRASARW